MNVRKLATLSNVALAASADAFSIFPTVENQLWGGAHSKSQQPRHVPSMLTSMRDANSVICLQAHSDKETDKPEDIEHDAKKHPDQDEHMPTSDGKTELFGIDQLGNKIRSILKNTRDGNEMELEIDDHLHDCYPSCDLKDMKYTVNHDDLSGRRQLRIDKKYLDTEASFYHQMMRDTVFAEWVPDEQGHYSLHIKMHVTDNPEGKGPLWEKWIKNSNFPEVIKDDLILIGAELRKSVFQTHEEDAVEVIFAVIRDLLNSNPDLLESKMFVHYLSDMELINEVKDLGTISEWLDMVEHHERLHFLSPEGNPWSKNIEIWKDSVAGLNMALKRLITDVLPKLMTPSATEVEKIIAHSLLMDMLVLTMLVITNNLSKH